MNLYQVAIKSIGSIIQYYNSSHQFGGFGFGAIVPPENKISHCFPLNNNTESPFCDSVDELLNHYKQTIQNVKLSGRFKLSAAVSIIAVYNFFCSFAYFLGPTCFAPIIDCAQNMAKNQEKNSYSVLLIITGKFCYFFYIFIYKTYFIIKHILSI